MCRAQLTLLWALLVTGAFVAAIGTAQEPAELPVPQTVPAVVATAAGAEPDAFGTTAETVLKIPAAAFRPQCAGGTLASYWNTGLTYIQSNLCYLHAPVLLPAGALVTQIGFDGYDVDPVLNIIGGSTTSAVTSPAPMVTSVAGITNRLAPGRSQAARRRSALPTRSMPATTTSSSWISRRSGRTWRSRGWVHYKLQICPAPSTATFPDVPTTYWAFQGIEALKASGITAGCTPPNFCPENPVTRAQMAVFLSKALGLHYPN